MANVTDTIRVRGLNWLDITVHYNGTSTTIPSIPDSEEIRVKVRVSRTDTTYGSAGSELDTGYASFSAVLSAVDANNAIVLINGLSTLTVTGTSGESITDDVLFDLTGKTGPLTISAETTATEDAIKTTTTGRTYKPNGWISRDTMAKCLVITNVASLNRTIPFTIAVEAQDGNGNTVITNDEITITLNNVDAADVFTSPTPDAVSYTANLSGGFYTLATQTITGGAGTDNANTITASATGYASDTTPSFTIAPAPTTLYSINGSSGASAVGASSNQVDAATAQGNANTTYRADTSFAEASTIDFSLSGSHHILSYETAYSAYKYGGYIPFSGITAGMKAAAITARVSNLRCCASLHTETPNVYSLLTGLTSLYVHFSESASEFASGAALDNATPDYTFTDSAIAALQTAAGYSGGTDFQLGKAITLDFGVALGSYIADMTGDTLYLWLTFAFASISGLDNSQKLAQIRHGTSYVAALEILG